MHRSTHPSPSSPTGDTATTVVSPQGPGLADLLTANATHHHPFRYRVDRGRKHETGTAYIDDNGNRVDVDPAGMIRIHPDTTGSTAWAAAILEQREQR